MVHSLGFDPRPVSLVLSGRREYDDCKMSSPIMYFILRVSDSLPPLTFLFLFRLLLDPPQGHPPTRREN